jgi:hypothetical protein
MDFMHHTLFSEPCTFGILKKSGKHCIKMEFETIASTVIQSHVYEQASIELFLNFHTITSHDKARLHEMCHEYLHDGDMFTYMNTVFLWDSYHLVPIKNNYLHDALYIEQLYLDKYEKDHFLYI